MVTQKFNIEKGEIFIKLTTAERNALSAVGGLTAGSMVTDTTEGKNYEWTGSVWTETGGGTTVTQKSFSLTVEVAEDGVPAPLATEIYRPVIDASIAVASMLYQSGTGAIRLVADTSTATDIMNVGDLVVISGSTNASNDGSYPVVAISSGYIDIWNPNRTAITDDETSSPATLAWKSKAIIRIRRFEAVATAFGYQSCKFQARLPEDYTAGTAIQLKPKFVAPDGGDASSMLIASGFVRVAVMNDRTGTDGSFETLAWGVDTAVDVTLNIGDTAKDKIYTIESADITMTDARPGSTFFIEYRRTTSALTQDIGLVEMGVLYE